MNMMPRNFYLRTLLEVTFIAMELYVALPLGIAIYPQRGAIKASDIEEEFRNIKDFEGQPIHNFYFNKGL